ncbi:MAG TPA: hypothetical protein VH370_24155 [Humisphaera sp.]|jgi:hypothetical protein|nr:hypothetical protein [Humisphaera sp.]
MQEQEPLDYGTKPRGHGAEMAMLLAYFTAIIFIILAVMCGVLWLMDRRS